MKKVMAILLALSMMSAVFAGCGQTPAPSSQAASSQESQASSTASQEASTPASDPKQESFTLKVAVESGMATPMEAAIELFKKDYPNAEVELITSSFGTSGADLRYKQLILIASDDIPDVGEMVWGKEFFKKGIILDLTDEIKSWEIYSKLTEGQLDRMSYQGRIYAITNSNNCPLFFYNKDILDELGASVPTTLDELQAIAKQIKDKGLKNKSGNPIYTINFEGGNWSTDYWLWANGGSQMNDDFSKTLIDSPESISAYQYMQDMIKNGYAPKVDGSGTNLFLNGQMAFILDGTWDIDSFKNAGLNFGITTLPTGSSGKNTVSAGGIEFGVFKNGKNNEAAIDFIKQIASKEYYVDYLESNGTGTSDISLYSDPKIQQILETKGWKEGYDAQQKQLANTAYNFLEAPFVYQDASKIYSDALARILVKLDDPATVMKEAAEQINQGIQNDQ